MRQGAKTGRKTSRRWVVPAAGVALVAIVGTAVALRGGGGGWGEESTPAEGPLPAPAAVQPGFSVRLSSFPLLVDDRLRVTGEENGIVAHPLTATDDRAHWRYGRPDHELLALSLSSTPAGGADAVVAALWDDGAVTAVDAATGVPVWRLQVADASPFYGDTFDPADLLDGGLLRTAAAPGGDVVVVQVDKTLVGVDAAAGSELWRHEVPLCDAAQSPMGHSRWWTMAGSAPIVVDVTCEMPDAELEVLDARSGEVTHEVRSEPSWRSTVPAEAGGLRPVGCRPDLTGCSLVEHYPTGSTFGKEPVRWASSGTQLVAPDQGEVPLDGVEARPNGEFEIFLVSRATGEVATTVTGEARTPMPQFVDAVATAEDAWVASQSWNGGPPALVRLSAADGSLTGCQASPTENPITHVRAPGQGFVAVSDLPWSRTIAYDPADPDGTVLLLSPQLLPTCPGA